MLSNYQYSDCPDIFLPGRGVNQRWRGAFTALVLLICCSSIDAMAADKGRFEIRSADSSLVDGVYFATARIDYRLSPEALKALESGITLTIQLQIEVLRSRRFWPDKTVASLHQDYQLSFHPLTARYVVMNSNSGQQSSFFTLPAALNHLGRVADLPIIDAALLDAKSAYRIDMRAVLDQDTLPGPLQMLAFWSDGFRLESDWYRWKLSE
jgi:hypothetical protein